MKILRLLFLLILAASFTICSAKVPFSRGVNLTNWFQAGSARQIQFTKYTKQDFINIKGLGSDVIRLPVNLHYMTNGSPNYTIDPLFYELLDQAVNWAEELQIYLILDNHTFDPSANTDPNIQNVLVKVWDQVSQHYKNRSNYLLYEILNEPHGISAQLWGQAQQAAINSIRANDTKHTIVVGGVNFNSYNDLQTIPNYTDTNLIYTFHFYDPFVFTHQGASWVTPSMVPLSGVPFPYDASKMPACPTSLKGSWIESGLNNYVNDGTVSKVKSLIDIAVNFKNSRNVDVFCGEFGVYIPNSNNDDRTYWYGVVRQYLEQKGIPWTIWDYQGGFGLFKKNSNELFNHDLNTGLLQSLGFNTPPQSAYILTPDTTGFRIYSDYVENKIYTLGGTSGTLDFYNTNLPNNEKYCIQWNDALQYNYIGFDFKPDKDLSVLVSNDYALDFMVRGTVAGTKFVVRFVDNKKDSTDHPWRMDYAIADDKVTWDGRWHHVRIPLKNFTDAGSWDNSWYNPRGLFDWRAVDVFDIVAEQGALTGKPLWFDNIQISNRDTATVRENIIVAVRDIATVPLIRFSVYPNPVHEKATILYELPVYDHIEISIYGITGERIATLINKKHSAGTYTIDWKCRNSMGFTIPNGVYICKLVSKSATLTRKIIVAG
ncbi:MAG: cellulase family glycosylhydrolase [Candidatus Dadabacteria bacterium]